MKLQDCYRWRKSVEILQNQWPFGMSKEGKSDKWIMGPPVHRLEELPQEKLQLIDTVLIYQKMMYLCPAFMEIVCVP